MAIKDALALKVAANVSDDLGARIADGRPITHEFRLRNPTDRPIQILGAMASTPCCSSIGPIPKSIPALGEAKVPVSFRPGYQSGRKRLQFVAATDRDGCRKIEMYLALDLLPSWEVQAVGESPDPIPEGRATSRAYRIITRRLEGEGLPPPTGLDVAAPFTARFVSEAAERRVDGGIVEAERRVEVDLPATAGPGTVAGDLRLTWADGSSQTYPMRWEVTSPVRLIPSTLVVRSGEPPRPVTFTIRSDDRPVRVLRVSGLSLARAFEPHPDVSRVHRLDLTIDGGSPERELGADIEVVTDHPVHPTLKIKVLVVPREGEVGS